jgi:hypothetical protein
MCAVNQSTLLHRSRLLSFQSSPATRGERNLSLFHRGQGESFGPAMVIIVRRPRAAKERRKENRGRRG